MATLEDVKKRPDYLGALTDKQRKWVDAYLTNGQDKIGAARAASPRCSTDEVAAAISYRNLQHPIISRIVNEFFGTANEIGGKDQCLGILWKRIQSQNIEDKYLLAFLELFGRWSGYEIKAANPTTPPNTESSVMDLVKEMENVVS